MATANAQSAYATLKAAGLPDGAALAVVGNLAHESGSDNLNTRAVGDGGTSHGIAQWHNDRWTRFLSWASGRGADPYSLDTQLAYVVVESKQMGVWDQLKATPDPLQASLLWVRKFEKPADQSINAAATRLQRGVSAVGSGAGSVLSSVAGLLENLPGVQVGKALVSGGSQLKAGYEASTTFFEHLLWWFNPTHILRVSVGVSGVFLIIVGIVLLSREVR